MMLVVMLMVMLLSFVSFKIKIQKMDTDFENKTPSTHSNGLCKFSEEYNE
jgi:hypothetical protein